MQRKDTSDYERESGLGSLRTSHSSDVKSLEMVCNPKVVFVVGLTSELALKTQNNLVQLI